MISVLLPYRDAAPTLAAAMQSVLHDLAPGDELVVIDDGSSDGSRAIAQAMQARDRRVVTTASGGTPTRPAGIPGALSRGVEVSRGALIGRMDADDESLPGRFAASRARLEAEPGLGAVAVMVEPFPTPGEGMQRYLAWQNAILTVEEHAREIFVESPLCHPATLLRREALLAVGGYREVAWAEDYDLWLRLDAGGYGLAKVPRVLFRWRMSSGSATWTDPHFARARFVEARAHYLAQRLRARGAPFAVWGAGKTGRRLARGLEANGSAPVAFVDIDPAKIGSAARGVPVHGPDAAIARARTGDLLLVVAVGARGARALVRARLERAGLRDGVSFICAA